jgi:predicted nucleic acid-binding protein
MIFVDTSFFYALASANDPDHERVREVFERFGDRTLRDFLLTTNHTALETVREKRRPPSTSWQSTKTRTTAPWTA